MTGPRAFAVNPLKLSRWAGAIPATAPLKPPMPPTQGWNPTQIPGLAVWLDATQVTGHADGEVLLVWADASGLSRNATSIDVAARPVYRRDAINGQPAVEFNGGNSSAARFQIPGLGAVLSGKTEYTMFFVVNRRPGSGATPCIVCAPVSAAFQWLVEYIDHQPRVRRPQVDS